MTTPVHPPAKPQPEPDPIPPVTVVAPPTDEASIRRQRRFHLLCLVLSALAVYPLLVPLGVGLVLGFVSEGPLRWAEAKLKIKRPLGRWLLAAAFETLVVLAFVIPVGLAIYTAIREVLGLVGDRHSDLLPTGRLESVTAWLGPKLAAAGIQVDTHDSLLGLGPRLRQAVISAGSTALGHLSAVLSSTPRALFNAALALAAWLVFAVEGKYLRNQTLPMLIPWPRERELISQVTAGVLRGLIVANLLVSVVQALICMVALGVFRVPRFFVWGVMSFFLSFIPVIGTTVVTLGSAAYLLSQGRIGAALGMGVIAVVVGTVDNLLRPLFMKGQVELGFFWSFVALLGGIATFGLAGAVLGPLLFALCIATRRAYDASVAHRDAPQRA
jgi:predicted PurR-regulated permease PerM